MVTSDEYKQQIQKMVKTNTYISTRESDFYREKIIEMLGGIYDTQYLKKIYTIVKHHTDSK